MSTSQIAIDFAPRRPNGQAAQILDYLLAGNRLTPLEALERFKCLRLGGRIYDLKKLGHPIQSRMVEVESGKHVSEYWIEREI